MHQTKIIVVKKINASYGLIWFLSKIVIMKIITKKRKIENFLSSNPREKTVKIIWRKTTRYHVRKIVKLFS